MRAVTGPETTVLGDAHYETHARISVEDADGVYQDLSSDPLDGLDWVHSGSINQTIDQIVATGSFAFWRNQEGGNSLSPLDQDSLLNRDGVGGYAPLIDAGRGIRVDFATTAIGTAPSGGDWKRVFEGEIDDWDATGDLVEVDCRDKIGVEIADRWVEKPTEYGVEEGKALELVMQDVLSDWTTLTLYVPTAPGFLVTPYQQRRMSVMEALQQLAALVGWALEPRWDDATSSFRLTFYEPDRAPGATTWTWAPGRYQTMQEFRLSRDDVRNALSIFYTDAGNERKQYTAEDTVSIAKYGRQWMEIEEPEDSPIDTLAEAQGLLDNALLDLKDPIAGQEIRTFCFWPIQLGDYYGFDANDVHYTVNQSFGVTGLRHEFGGGHVDTFIRTRGKPAGFTAAWIVRGGTGRLVDDERLATSLHDVRVLYDTPTDADVTVAWRRGSKVKEVWYYLTTLTQPIVDADKPWPDDIVAPTGVLVRGTDQLVFAVPVSDQVAFLQLEPRDDDGFPGDPIRVEIHPKAVSSGADLPADGGIISGALDAAIQGFGSDIVPSATDWDTVAWSAFTITLSDGTTVYNIDAGNTGNIPDANLRFIGLDTAISTTVLQVVSDITDLIGDGKILLGWAKRAPASNQKAAFQFSVGLFGLNNDNVGDNTISGNLVQANTLTGTHIVGTTLSAIFADLGTVTAGTISANVIVASDSFTAANPSFTGNVSITGTLDVLANVNFKLSSTLTFQKVGGSPIVLSPEDNELLISKGLIVTQDITALSEINVNVIAERTGGSGVTIDGVVLKDGAVTGTDDVIAFSSSDIRLKKYVRPITDPIEKILRIRGVGFTWKKKAPDYLEGRDVGVLAHEVQEVLPEAVRENANGYLGVNYLKLIPLLVEAVKAQQRQVDELNRWRAGVGS